MEAAGGNFPINGRCRIDIDAGVHLTWASDWFGYDWGTPFLREKLRSMPGISAASPYAGAWTLDEIKSLNDAQGALKDATAAVVAKLGSGWTIDVDYASFEANTRGNSYRSNVGKYVIDSIVGGFVKNDIGAGAFDGDVVEATNDKVGGAKKVTFKMGPAGAYAINGRLNLTVGAAGVSLEWAADWFAYDYGDKFLADWILAHC